MLIDQFDSPDSIEQWFWFRMCRRSVITRFQTADTLRFAVSPPLSFTVQNSGLLEQRYFSLVNGLRFLKIRQTGISEQGNAESGCRARQFHSCFKLYKYRIMRVNVNSNGRDSEPRQAGLTHKNDHPQVIEYDQ